MAVKSNTVKHVFMGAAGMLLNADMVQAGGSYMTLIHAFLVSAVEIHHVRMVMAAVERNRVQYVFIGAAGKQLNADVVQAGRRYMTFIHAFLVSAMEIYHMRVVTAVVESNNVQLVFMGAARMIVNVDMVQAGSGCMTFIHAFLVSAAKIYHMGVVMAMVESNKAQQVFMGAAGMMANVDMVQARSGRTTFMHAFPVSAMESNHVRVVTAVVESNEVKHASMGAARLLFNAKVVQASSMYMIFMYAFLVSAVDIYHRRVVTAAVKSNKVQHVSIGAAGIPFNAKVVQASNRSMTFMYALLVSAVTDHYVKMVTTTVKSKAVKDVV